MNEHLNQTEPFHVSIANKDKITIQFLAAIGSLQAIVIIITILTSSKLRKKITYIFVINLLFAQLLMCSITIPMYCFAPHHFLYPFLSALTITSYILNLCTVTYERYLAICQPYRYFEKLSYSKALKTSVLCWIIAAITQILPIIWKHHKYAVEIQRAYLGVTLFFIFVVPLIMIWLVYGYISIEMFRLSKTTQCMTNVKTELAESSDSDLSSPDTSPRQHRKSYFTVLTSKFRRDQRPQQEFRLALVFIAAAITSNITWVPVILMVLLQVINRAELEPEGMSKTHLYLLVINANIDALIYGLFLRPLRKRLFSSWLRKPFKLRKDKNIED